MPVETFKCSWNTFVYYLFPYSARTNWKHFYSVQDNAQKEATIKQNLSCLY